MRHGLYGGIALLTAAITLAGPPLARAQDGALGQGFGGAGVSDYPISGEPSEKIPIPTGNPGSHGFYTFFEFTYLTGTWTLGEQTVAYRGLVDSTGLITRVPGTYIGSGVKALSTNEFGRQSWMPGFNIGVGYKLDDGTSVYASYLYSFNTTYGTAATLAAPFFRSRGDLADTFLVAGVFNFPPQYAGPNVRTQVEQVNNANAFYGVWNGASDMVIEYTNRYNQAEIGARVPMFQTEYSRIYGLAGGRFSWFFDRFQWRSISYDINGTAGPRDAANYENSLSQRMYGPFIGCGHEMYVGKRLSVSLDLTAAGLLNIVKERAKYELGDESIQNKRSKNEFTVVPSFTGNLNLWWYPVEGVQMRVGYNAMTFFNTKNLDQPIGFNYGAIDPVYGTQVFRLMHGLNAGIGLFF